MFTFLSCGGRQVACKVHKNVEEEEAYCAELPGEVVDFLAVAGDLSAVDNSEIHRKYLYSIVLIYRNSLNIIIYTKADCSYC